MEEMNNSLIDEINLNTKNLTADELLNERSQLNTVDNLTNGIKSNVNMVHKSDLFTNVADNSVDKSSINLLVSTNSDNSALSSVVSTNTNTIDSDEFVQLSREIGVLNGDKLSDDDDDVFRSKLLGHLLEERPFKKDKSNTISVEGSNLEENSINQPKNNLEKNEIIETNCVNSDKLETDKKNIDADAQDVNKTIQLQEDAIVPPCNTSENSNDNFTESNDTKIVENGELVSDSSVTVEESVDISKNVTDSIEIVNFDSRKSATESKDTDKTPLINNENDIQNNKSIDATQEAVSLSDEDNSSENTETTRIVENVNEDEKNLINETNEEVDNVPAEVIGNSDENKIFDGDTDEDIDDFAIMHLEPVMELTVTDEIVNTEKNTPGRKKKNKATDRNELSKTVTPSKEELKDDSTEKSLNQGAANINSDTSKLGKLRVRDDISKEKEVPEIFSGTTSGRPQRRAAKKAESQIRVMVASGDVVANEPPESTIQSCFFCNKVRACKYIESAQNGLICICNNCEIKKNSVRVSATVTPIPYVVPTYAPVAPKQLVNTATRVSSKNVVTFVPKNVHFKRKCSQCNLRNIVETKSLSWETMDFCNEECLGRYQMMLGAYCARCKGAVQQTGMGKYCVRFGLDIKQFCSGNCLEEFKKCLKVCAYCQIDISQIVKPLIATFKDKSQKEFCSSACIKKFERLNTDLGKQFGTCVVCNTNRETKIEMLFNNTEHKLCSDVCYAAFKFCNKINNVEQCNICKKHFDETRPNTFFVFNEDTPLNFCSKLCLNLYILVKRKIVPCDWCKVKKYNFDMIKKVTVDGGCLLMCSLNCLTLYQVSINAVTARKIKCDNCKMVDYVQFHQTMTDATIKNFCSHNCVMLFQSRFNKSNPEANTPVPLGAPKRVVFQNKLSDTKPVIDVTSQPAIIDKKTVINTTNKASEPVITADQVSVKKPNEENLKYVQHIVVQPPAPKIMKNKCVQVRPKLTSKSICCRPLGRNTFVQTDNIGTNIQTKNSSTNIQTKNSATDVQREISGTVLKTEISDTSALPSVIPVPFYIPIPMPLIIPVPVPIFVPFPKKRYKNLVKSIEEIKSRTTDKSCESSDTEMAAKSNEKEVSDEDESGSNTDPELNSENIDISTTASSSSTLEEHVNRKRKNSAECAEKETLPVKKLCSFDDPTENTPVESIQSSGNLKYEAGVTTWNKWFSFRKEQILTNDWKDEIGSAAIEKDLSKLTDVELNYLLKIFVKEVEKADSSVHDVTTIFYLCLGIQQYLYLNSREDNIFMDTSYNSFTDSLNEEILKDEPALDSRLTVDLISDTAVLNRQVEEEHLWECRQLGAHSPQVLLGTVFYFHTKYFKFLTIEEHTAISFVSSMERWQSSTYENSDGISEEEKKKHEEMFALDDKSFKCPAKLYEFYLSKCPTNMKERDDVFYLEPEGNCLPNSPVWFSSTPMTENSLQKILNRVKLVKEIKLLINSKKTTL